MRLPVLAWDVVPVGAGGASVVVTLPAPGTPALLLVSHLDTSLSGHPVEDEPVTGRSDAPAALRFEGDEVSGFGLGVARGPAAAALAGLAAVAEALRGRPHRPVQLLLAGSGTHRSALPAPLPTGSVRPSSSAGAAAHLTADPRPDAVLVAKAGPPAVVRAEPGACYVRLTVTGRWGAALTPASAAPVGGVLLHAGAVLTAVAEWREGFVARRRGRPDGLGGEVGVGAVTAGRPDKPDLLPATLDLRLYVVTVPGDDPVGLAEELACFVRDALVGTALAPCAVVATAEPLHPAGITAATAPVALAADRAWRAHLPLPPAPLQDWTGSTDGVLFRQAGIDTVRLGPASRPDPEDGRRERLSLAELQAFAAIYADVAGELATA